MTQKIAVLGCGYWGKNLVRNFHALGCLDLVCDPHPEARALAMEVAPGVRVSSSFEEGLQDCRIDAVIISTPAATHYLLAKEALLADKDVFVEKPLCLHTQDAEELLQLADRRGRVLMVGHLLQYHPCINTLSSMVSSGDLGKLQYITSNRLNMGKIRREENALWSFAPHDLSVILSLAGNELPTQIRTTGGGYLNEEVADTTLTAMRFSSGVRAHVFVSWLNPFKEQKLTVVGSSGMAVFDDTLPWEEKLVCYRQHITWKNGRIPTPSKANGEAIIPDRAEPLAIEVQHFLKCCKERRSPKTNGKEGLRVLSVLEAAQWSLDNDGKSVDPTASLHRMTQSEPTNTRSTGHRTGEAYSAHPTAVIDEGAQIGKGTKVWHFSHVMPGANIGQNCVFGQNVNVDGDVVIGSNVKVQNNVSIYSGTEIGDDVFLGPSCVLTNVTNPRSQVNRHQLYEKTRIRRGATIGANATVVCGVTIGRYAFVGAGAVVTKSVPDYALVIGNPARQRGWISRHGHIMKKQADNSLFCPESGFRYELGEDNCLRCVDLAEEEQLPETLRVGEISYRDFKASEGSRREE